MAIQAKIVADSVSPAGKRLTTLVLRFPRFILAELNTHRMLSRNSSSSRAIPIKKLIEQVRTDPVIPVWGKNQPGMQAREQLAEPERQLAERHWRDAAITAADEAENLSLFGVHKQAANRLLEPFMWTTTIVTATEWDNFFALRCHPDAQPEMKALADAMLVEMNNNLPSVTRMHEGQWHLPFVKADELFNLLHDYGIEGLEVAKKCSVARCARVSYLNHDGSAPNVDKDVALADRLAADGHMSPFEHQAMPLPVKTTPLYGSGRYVQIEHQRSGNFLGWLQYRQTMRGQDREFSGLAKWSP